MKSQKSVKISDAPPTEAPPASTDKKPDATPVDANPPVPNGQMPFNG